MKGRISKENVPRDQDMKMKVPHLEAGYNYDTDEDPVRINNIGGSPSEELNIIKPLPFDTIELPGPNGEPNKVEALINTGSQLNAMDHSTCLSARLEREPRSAVGVTFLLLIVLPLFVTCT